MPDYLERRIDTWRVFVEVSRSSEIIKSIPRTVIHRRWGRVGGGRFSSEKIIFRSEKTAADYVEGLLLTLREQLFSKYDGPDDPRLLQQRQSLFDDALATIERLRCESPETTFFPPAPHPDVLTEFELETGIDFPIAYQQFMARWDGGYFLPTQEFSRPLPDDFQKSLRGNPEVFLYSAAQARERYGAMIKDSQPHREAFQALRAIPIGESGNGETVLLRMTSSESNPAGVIFHFHDVPPSEWNIEFPCFEEMVIGYVGCRAERSPFSTFAVDAWKPPIMDTPGRMDGVL